MMILKNGRGAVVAGAVVWIIAVGQCPNSAALARSFLPPSLKKSAPTIRPTGLPLLVTSSLTLQSGASKFASTAVTRTPTGTTTSLHVSPTDDDATKGGSDEDNEALNSDNAAARVPRGGSGSVGRNAPPALPTLKQYALFAFPCLALWVAGPLLSLVDTAFVGLSSSSTIVGSGVASSSASQLAALGPATTL